MSVIDFFPGKWEGEGLRYAYSLRFPDRPLFRQEADCVVNGQTSGGDWDYMGLLLPGEYGAGAVVSARCAFEGDGAPMLLLSMENGEDGDGCLLTLEYYEIVIWKNGLNVWRHYTENGTTSHYLALGASFPLEAGKIHTLTGEFREKRMLLSVGGMKFNLYVPDLTKRFTLGYTACEGLCRLYGMEVR